METIINEVHKNIRKVKQFRKVFSEYKNEIWGCDLVEMIPFNEQNNSYKYILTVIDVYSRFAWAIPIKSKTGKDVVDAFESIFKKN